VAGGAGGMIREGRYFDGLDLASRPEVAASVRVPPHSNPQRWLTVNDLSVSPQTPIDPSSKAAVG
jgi:hypothetical protein